jgi:hypothetical protein
MTTRVSWLEWEVGYSNVLSLDAPRTNQKSNRGVWRRHSADYDTLEEAVEFVDELVSCHEVVRSITVNEVPDSQDEGG